MAVTKIPINVMSANVKMDGEENIVISLPENYRSLKVALNTIKLTQ
jgi:hypothetical protein